MLTTVDLDDELFREAMRRHPERTEKSLLEAAFRALIRESARERLIRAGGTMPDLGEPAPRRRSE